MILNSKIHALFLSLEFVHGITDCGDSEHWSDWTIVDAPHLRSNFDWKIHFIYHLVLLMLNVIFWCIPFLTVFSGLWVCPWKGPPDQQSGSLDHRHPHFYAQCPRKDHIIPHPTIRNSLINLVTSKINWMRIFIVYLFLLITSTPFKTPW